MREGARHSETVRAGTPITVGAVTLLPIERVVLHVDRHTAHLWCSAFKEPCAIVVRDAGGIRAIDIGTTAVSLEVLRTKIPGLDAMLASSRTPGPG